MSSGVDAAAVALAHIEGFSDEERQAIIDLLKLGRMGPGHDGRATPLPVLIDRAFTWAEFDRWHAFFSARRVFPVRWDGLHGAPGSEASPAMRASYRQRKLELLLEWLDMLAWQASELDRYTKQGLRVRIVRQEDGHRCPVCESLNAREVRHGSDPRPPLHPGCRCVLMAVPAVAAHDRNGAHPRR